MSDRVHKLCAVCISDILSDILSIGHYVSDLCLIDIGSIGHVSSETTASSPAQSQQSNAEKVAQETNAGFRVPSAMYAVLAE